jgi:hypothetical protein
MISSGYRAKNLTGNLIGGHLAKVTSILFKFRYLALAVACLIYVGVINNVGTQGYVLSDLQKELKRSRETSANLEMQLTALQALPRLESEATALAMTQQPGIDYLSTAGTIVASR